VAIVAVVLTITSARGHRLLLDYRKWLRLSGQTEAHGCSTGLRPTTTCSPTFRRRADGGS
jgi:hypothetical protein